MNMGTEADVFDASHIEQVKNNCRLRATLHRQNSLNLAHCPKLLCQLSTMTSQSESELIAERRGK